MTDSATLAPIGGPALRPGGEAPGHRGARVVRGGKQVHRVRTGVRTRMSRPESGEVVKPTRACPWTCRCSHCTDPAAAETALPTGPRTRSTGTGPPDRRARPPAGREGPVAALPRALTPLRHPGYRWLAASLVLSLTSAGLYLLAVVWQVIALGGGPGAL